MSKDQKEFVDQPVETVEKIIDYCISTMDFWKCDKDWPLNLIKDALLESRKILALSKLRNLGETK